MVFLTTQEAATIKRLLKGFETLMTATAERASGAHRAALAVISDLRKSQAALDSPAGLTGSPMQRSATSRGRR